VIKVAYIDSIPKECKKKQKQLLYKLEKKREMFYNNYKYKVKRVCL